MKDLINVQLLYGHIALHSFTTLLNKNGSANSRVQFTCASRITQGKHWYSQRSPPYCGQTAESAQTSRCSHSH